MTSLSLIVGALPVAIGIHVLASGEGSEFRKGLAVVLIGGLTTSTLLTLLVVPTAYSLMDSIVSRVMGLFGKKNDDVSDDESVAVAAQPSTASPSHGSATAILPTTEVAASRAED